MVYLKFLPLKVLIACFCRTFRKFDVYWTNRSNDFRKSLSWQLLFEVSLFRFIFFLHFNIYNIIIMNIQRRKQPPLTRNCFWNLYFLISLFVIFGKLRKKQVRLVLIFFFFFWEGGGVEGGDLRVGATQQKCGCCYSYLIS